MKRITLFLLLVIFSGKGFSTTWTVNSSNTGNAFIPNSLMINAGDSVSFVLTSMHNAVEVSEATWNANGTTPLAGGFSVPFGGGLVTPEYLLTGVHYYVCQNHIASGMKGTIMVTGSSGVNQVRRDEKSFIVFPSIVSDKVNAKYFLDQNGHVEIRLIDLLGNVVAVPLSTDEIAGDHEHNFYIDRSIIRAGIYIAQIVVGNRREEQKIIVN